VSEPPVYPTALGASSREAITLLGADLAREVMGTVGFGELAFWLATQRRPTPGETRVFEAVLAALADHGFTPTAIVTRLTYLSAPDSVQGALAAGLLGGGSRFLGVTEDCGRFLHDVLAGVEQTPTDDAGWDAWLTTFTSEHAGYLRKALAPPLEAPRQPDPVLDGKGRDPGPQVVLSLHRCCGHPTVQRRCRQGSGTCRRG